MRLMIRVLSFAAAAVALAGGMAAPARAEPAHGFAVLGTLKYPAGFPHFDYSNPDAPKGGNVRLWAQGGFDTLNPFILKGRKAAGSGAGALLTFETLMMGSGDEPDSYYGLIAKTVELPDDRHSITFDLRPEARFHDGSEITADDVVFSFDTLKAKGHPIYRVIYKDVLKAEKLARQRVRFQFDDKAQLRDLPKFVAEMPILSKAYYDAHDITKTTLDPPLGSGPYRVGRVDAPRTISYDRLEGHWGQDLGVYKGRFDFDRLTWFYFRDRDVALEALFAGKLDFREEFTSKTWMTKYNVPPVKQGLVKRESLPDNTPSGFQAFYYNTRRAKFQDRRVRQAIGLAFDFEWTNKNIFNSLYQRSYSMFQNSDMEAKGKPSEAELALLEPYRAKLPKEVFDDAYRPPKTDGTGRVRRELRISRKLLQSAGWRIRDGVLKNSQGEALKIEFLSFGRLFERIINGFINNLNRLGIEAKFRLVDTAQYKRRLDAYEFDIITVRVGGSLTPGLALKNSWNSEVVEIEGARNYTGLRSPVVDALIEKIIAARTRDELRVATRALDRVVMNTHNVIPQWFKAAHHIAYWDKFSRPAVKPKYARGVLDLWWLDRAKEAALKAKQ